MYQFSRGIYRELAAEIRPTCGRDIRSSHAYVLRACESTMERLATDRHYFARPARTLFGDIRIHFAVARQEHVWAIVSRYLSAAEQWLLTQPSKGYDVNGNPLECRATTRRGTPCQRMPLPHNGYCPSHQHLVETEEPAEALAA